MTLARELVPQLRAWSRTVHGAGANVDNVRSLGGLSGVTVGFDVVAGGRIADRLVLKIAPKGVKRQNNFDILRQVPILRAAEAAGIPAPRARYWSDDEALFGSPYLVMTLLAGRQLPDLFTPQSGQGVSDAEALFAQPIDALVKLHGIDVKRHLADWNVVRMPADEIDHWAAVLQKSCKQADWVTLGLRVRDRLHPTMPKDTPIGVVHGDFYSNNWVFDGRQLSGIVDWEGASIGPSLIDLGWVSMMYDKDSWGTVRRQTMDWHPGPQFFIERYRNLSPLDLSDVDWYRALAGYRLACITTYYLERHRSGKVSQPSWEVLGESVPFMFRRAAQLLGNA